MKRLISFELFSLKNNFIDILMIIVFLTLIALKGTDYYFLFIPIMIYRPKMTPAFLIVTFIGKR